MYNRLNNTLIIIILVTVSVIAIRNSDLFESKSELAGQTGLVSVDCWFKTKKSMPQSECFQMQVLEDHANPQSNMISFPVVVIRTAQESTGLSPVLHLGAGGPGAPMFLDSTASIEYIIDTHDAMSINQARDLILIDPRGSGLSRPLLSCQLFVDNEPGRLAQNLTPQQDFESINSDYVECIEEFAAIGINFKNYNSHQVMLDVEMLRQQMQIEKWVLVGVSYATIYAQLLAREFPESVESMVLDSTAFLEAEPHRYYVDRSLTSYRAILNYCEYDPDCDHPMPDFESRFWALHAALNKNPITLELYHPYESGNIDYVLNGERMLAALVEAVYDAEVFKQMPQIIEQLENRDFHHLIRYMNSSLSYLLDRTYGDVSADAHYCYDIRPYTDLEYVRAELNQLPPGYLKQSSLQGLDWGDYCDELKIDAGNPDMIEPESIEVPVLFLHGDHDPVTPISRVLEHKPDFLNSLLIRFDLSHSILTSSELAENKAAEFIGRYSTGTLEAETINPLK
jgi:pimeloyl-ACP methyl ester carboxylesterase